MNDYNQILLTKRKSFISGITGLILASIFPCFIYLELLKSLPQNEFILFSFILFLLVFFIINRFISHVVDCVTPSLEYLFTSKGFYSLNEYNYRYHLSWNNISYMNIEEEIGYSVSKEEFVAGFSFIPSVLKMKIFDCLHRRSKDSINPDLIEIKEKYLIIKIKNVDDFVDSQHRGRRNIMILRTLITNKKMEKEIKIELADYRKTDVDLLEEQLPSFIQSYLK